jgi:hypothetical protein
MPNWLQAEARWESLPAVLQQLEGSAFYLTYLRERPQPESWQQEELRRLEASSEADQRRLADLRQEQQRLHEARGRVLEAERMISRFGNQHGIDARALHRFIVWGDRAAAGDAVRALWMILDALDQEPAATAPDALNPPDDSHSDRPPASRQDAPEAPPPGPAEGTNRPHLTANEYSILQHLARVHPQLIQITDLAADLSCRRAAVGESVSRLEALGLASRPQGERSGVGITPVGLTTLRPEDLPSHLRPANSARH